MAITATLAQTFSTEGHEGGFVLSSINLFFKTKDATAPIRLEIRETVSGAPSATTLGGSVVIKAAADVLVNTSAQTATKFVFANPVVLKPSTEYAIVLSTNSTKYNLWQATLGKVAVNKQAAVGKQPNSGTLFMTSGSGTVWEPNLMSDLMFTIYKASFSTSNFTLAYKTAPITRKFSSGNIINTMLGQTIVFFTVKAHGLMVADKVELSVDTPSTTTYNGIPVTNINGVSQTTVKEHTVTWVSSDGNSFAIDTLGTAATATGVCKVRCLSLTVNMKADVIYPSVNYSQPAGTTVSFTAKTTRGKSLAVATTPGVEYATEPTFSKIAVNTNIELDAPIIFASEPNRINKMGINNNMEFRVGVATNNQFMVPLVDKDVSIIAVDNILGDITAAGNLDLAGKIATYLGGTGTPSEASIQGGAEASKYISQHITLQTSATSLRISFAANMVAGNYVDVYYKTSATDSVEDVTWVKKDFPTNAKYASTRAQFIDYTLEQKGMTEFKTFAVKLVLRGTNSSIPPRVKQLQVLALAI